MRRPVIALSRLAHARIGDGRLTSALAAVPQRGPVLTFQPALAPRRYVAREQELADAEAEVAAGGANTPASKGGLEGMVLMRVGPFMAEYERLAARHLDKGSEQSALIACERSQRCFEAWGR